jgi:hypothetical protein
MLPGGLLLRTRERPHACSYGRVAGRGACVAMSGALLHSGKLSCVHEPGGLGGTCWVLEAGAAQAGVPAAPLRWDGGPEGGSPAEDWRDRAAGVAAAEAAAEAGSDVAADAAADVGTEAASECPADWPPGTKNAGTAAAAVPLAAKAPACSQCFTSGHSMCDQAACMQRLQSRTVHLHDDVPTQT